MLRRMKAISLDDIAISVIVVGELLVGAEKSQDIRSRLEVEAFVKSVRIVPVDEKIAGTYSKVRATLEKSGAKLDANDLWIAATALVHDAILVTADEAFDRVPGLRTENWRR